MSLVGENGVIEVVEATPEHPFFVQGAGWVPLSELHPGMVLLSDTSLPVEVVDVSDEYRFADTYTIEVEGNHNFFVSNLPVLVHNAGVCDAIANLGGRFAKYAVGKYNELNGAVSGLDAHHVGQKAIMKKLIPGYDPNTAPSILVPKVGHTIKGPNGIVSRSMKDLATPRQVLARDIKELRRVYKDIPNSQLQKLIKMNKDAYPNSF